MVEFVINYADGREAEEWHIVFVGEFLFYLQGMPVFGSLITVMGQVLRITYNNSDYTFQILNQSPVSRETEKIQILLDGAMQTLVCRNGQWLPGESTTFPDTGLVNAIGKMIALRYRI